MKPETLARWESKIRPAIVSLGSPHQVTKLYSAGRKDFLAQLAEERPPIVRGSIVLQRTLWGLDFRSPIINAAGMWKNGRGYDVSFYQGAGGFLGGTTVWNDRIGNVKDGIENPFAPFPRSGMAGNSIGLRNSGDPEVAEWYENKIRVPDFPLGHSVMGSPDIKDRVEKIDRLVDGMRLYEEAGVDWLENNWSCPNTEEDRPDFDALERDVIEVNRYFLRNRSRKYGRVVPVVAKLSNDIPLSDVPRYVDMFIDYGYDGLNIGNTSTNYESLRHSVHPKERRLFDYFISTFGGGFSGSALKNTSALLCKAAVDRVEERKPDREFHIFRTGGIEGAEDLIISDEIGVSMNQWFTGYFEQFAQHGHKVYEQLYKKLTK